VTVRGWHQGTSSSDRFLAPYQTPVTGR
jgi:hypothetical protein